VGHRQDDWCDKLAYLEFAYSSAKNKTTGQTPFLLNYGQKQLEFSDLLLTREPNTVPSASDFVADMQELAEAAAASIEQKNKATAEYQNAKRKDYVLRTLLALSAFCVMTLYACPTHAPQPQEHMRCHIHMLSYAVVQHCYKYIARHRLQGITDSAGAYLSRDV
jgi:hypothetical protein